MLRRAGDRELQQFVETTTDLTIELQRKVVSKLNQIAPDHEFTPAIYDSLREMLAQIDFIFKSIENFASRAYCGEPVSRAEADSFREMYSFVHSNFKEFYK